MKRIVLFVMLSLVALGVSVTQSDAAMSAIHGTVYWYDQYGNLHPLSWVQVVATADDGSTTTVASSTEGTYVMSVSPGTYEVSVSSPGFISQSYNATVTDGGMVVVDFQLEPSGEPVPEYPPSLQQVMLVVAALAAIVLIRRRQRAMPMNSQSAPAS